MLGHVAMEIGAAELRMGSDLGDALSGKRIIGCGNPGRRFRPESKRSEAPLDNSHLVVAAKDRLMPPLPRAERFRAVHGDAANPGSQRRALLKQVEPVDDGELGILDDLFYLGKVPVLVLDDGWGSPSTRYATSRAGATRADAIPRSGLPSRNRTLPLSTVPDSASPAQSASPGNSEKVQVSFASQSGREAPRFAKRVRPRADGSHQRARVDTAHGVHRGVGAGHVEVTAAGEPVAARHGRDQAPRPLGPNAQAAWRESRIETSADGAPNWPLRTAGGIARRVSRR